jgi:Amt family ammonium transporter
MLNADDSLDVFGVHGIGGIAGSLMTGLMASRNVSGADGNVAIQLIGCVAVLAYSGVMTYVLLWLTRVIVGLRVDEAAEAIGLDISQHREQLGS